MTKYYLMVVVSLTKIKCATSTSTNTSLNLSTESYFAHSPCHLHCVNVCRRWLLTQKFLCDFSPIVLSKPTNSSTPTLQARNTFSQIGDSGIENEQEQQYEDLARIRSALNEQEQQNKELRNEFVKNILYSKTLEKDFERN